MKVYREGLAYATDTNETKILLDVIKSISVSVGIGGDYALILGEFSVYQSNVEKTRRNIVKCGFCTLSVATRALNTKSNTCQILDSCQKGKF